MTVIYIILVIYFLPSIISLLRFNKINITFIVFLANIFLGWTIIYWFLLLSLSLTGDRQLYDDETYYGDYKKK